MSELNQNMSEEEMKKVVVLKKDIKKDTAIEHVREMYKFAKTKNPLIMKTLFKARCELLEGISETYIEEGEDDLFEIAMEETAVLKRLINK